MLLQPIEQLAVPAPEVQHARARGRRMNRRVSGNGLKQQIASANAAGLACVCQPLIAGEAATVLRLQPTSPFDAAGGPCSSVTIERGELVCRWQRIREQQATVVAPGEEPDSAASRIARNPKRVQQRDPRRSARGAGGLFVIEAEPEWVRLSARQSSAPQYGRSKPAQRTGKGTRQQP